MFYDAAVQYEQKKTSEKKDNFVHILIDLFCLFSKEWSAFETMYRPHCRLIDKWVAFFIFLLLSIFCFVFFQFFSLLCTIEVGLQKAVHKVSKEENFFVRHNGIDQLNRRWRLRSGSLNILILNFIRPDKAELWVANFFRDDYMDWKYTIFHSIDKICRFS